MWVDMSVKKIFSAIALFLSVTCALPAGALMLTQRHSHTMTLLPDGNVLIIGGVTTDGLPTNSVELYNVSQASYQYRNSTCIPYSSHTATLLPNGKVLVTGGVDRFGITLSSMSL